VCGLGKRIKLVHIVTVPWTLGFFRGQMRYMQSRGFEVHAISSPGDLLAEVREREGIEVHTVPMNREIDPVSDSIALWRLWRLLRTLKPDVVHCHTPKASLLGTIAARAAGVRAVMLSIFGLPQMTRTGLPHHLLNLSTRVSSQLAGRVWCDSFSLWNYIVRQGLCPAKRLAVLGQGSANGVDADGTFSPARFGPVARAELRSIYRIPADAIVLGFAGRIVGDKGMHELASAWRLLRDRHPSLHLLLVGPFEPEDPLLPEDEALFRQDSRIHVAGMQRDMAHHFAVMDIYVMPSRREGFGITNIEASAMRLPIVATDIPGCVDSVKDGVTGTLVPARDSNALAEAIESYYNDAELRQKHGQAGRERVLRDFRRETIWGALYDEYERLVNKNRLPVVSAFCAGRVETLGQGMDVSGGLPAWTGTLEDARPTV
jgi:glycosyltransferase involved in cell wall biosynthesis